MKRKNMSIEALKLSIEKTSEARFNQEKRLALHGKMSDITLAVVSTTLVAIPLINAFNLASPYSSDYINFIQVIFAISVLVQSIFLSKAEFKLNSYLAHRCAMELREIFQEVEFSEEEYTLLEVNKKYNECIKRYSNHKGIDYYKAKVENSMKWKGKESSFVDKFKLKLNYFYEFSFYYITISVVMVWTGLFLDFS